MTQILPRGKKEFEKNNLIFIPHVNCPLIEKRQVLPRFNPKHNSTKKERVREKKREKKRERRDKSNKNVPSYHFCVPEEEAL